MSPFAVSCPSCRTTLRHPGGSPGQTVKCKCPKCGVAFEASMPTPPPPPSIATPPAPARAPVANPMAPPPSSPPARPSAARWIMAGGLAAAGALMLTCCAGIAVVAMALSNDKPGGPQKPVELVQGQLDPGDPEPGPDQGGPPNASPPEPQPIVQAGGVDEPPAVQPKAEPPKYRDGRLIVPFAAIASRERLERVKGVQLKGTIRFATATNVNNVTITWEGLKRLKYEEFLILGYSKILLVGSHGWMADEKRNITLEGDGLGFYQNFNYATVLSNLIALTGEGFDIEKGADRSVRGKQCFTIIVRRVGRPTMTMFFEKQSDLLYKADFRGKFVDQNLNFSPDETDVEFFFSDYQTTDGIKQWRKQEQWRDGKSYSVFTVSDVRFMEKTDDSFYVLPGLEAQVRSAIAAEKTEGIKRAASQSPAKSGSDFARLVAGLTRGNPAQRPLFQEALLVYVDLSRKGQLEPLEAADVSALALLLSGDIDAELRRFAIEAIGRMGPQAASAAPALCAAAQKSADPATLAAVLTALRKTGVKTDEALAAFEKRLDHADDGVKNAAAHALLTLAPGRIQLNRALELMARSDPEVRKAAEGVLRLRLALCTAKDLPQLRDGLKNPHAGVRIVFADAIGALKTGAQEAAPDLAKLAGDADVKVADHAVAALKSVGKLADVARDHADPKVLVAAIDALRKDGAQSADALAIYQKHAGNADAAVKDAAHLALLAFAPERIKTNRLPELAKAANPELRGAAKRLLADRSVVLTSTVGGLKAEIVSAKLAPLPFMRRAVSGLKEMETPDTRLIIKVRITNTSDINAAKYTPWHLGRERTRTPTAKDADGKALAPWFADTAEWPVGGVQAARKIEPGTSVFDIVAFSAPPASSYEIDIKLPADNLGAAGQWFEFKMVRPYFEKKK